VEPKTNKKAGHWSRRGPLYKKIEMKTFFSAKKIEQNRGNDFCKQFISDRNCEEETVFAKLKNRGKLVQWKGHF
jgi:hypothetical protein